MSCGPSGPPAALDRQRTLTDIGHLTQKYGTQCRSTLPDIRAIRDGACEKDRTMPRSVVSLTESVQKARPSPRNVKNGDDRFVPFAS